MGASPESSRAEASRARLQSAAVDAFSEKGFHGTTTRDIAAAAGMSPAAMYVHHKSKEELLHLIASAGHERTLTVVRDARSSATRPHDQLAAMVREYCAWHARSHVLARVINYELAALSVEHLSEAMHQRRLITTEFREVIEDGLAAGEFATADPAMLTAALTGLGIDLARWYAEDRGWSPEQLGDFYADLALRMAGA